MMIHNRGVSLGYLVAKESEEGGELGAECVDVGVDLGLGRWLAVGE
jgi:hypothetical protein